MSNRLDLLVAGLGAVLTAPAMAETHRVPQEFPTIQAAINAAIDGDIVIVGRGTWSGPGNYDIDLLGKAITVRSVAGPETCIIDASNAAGFYRGGFLFTHNESSATVVDGFTITGGYLFNGGAIYVESGSPVIQNCIITGNTCDCWGAAVYLNSQTNATIRDCVIVGNTSAAEGGGVFTIDCGGRIENCTISDNVANTGGGICVFGGDVAFISCSITDNYSSSYGGGGYVYEGNLINCTIADNATGWEAAGLYTWDTATTITNSIIWGNTGAAQLLGSPRVTYSIVEGGYAGQGNVSVAPRFVNATTGDYRLAPGSPGIDAGSNPAVPAGITTDANGSPRFVDDSRTPDSGVGPFPVIDIGAFEFRPSRSRTR